MGWSVLFLECRSRRNDAEWSFHVKALQRRPVLQKLYNTTHSGHTNLVNQKIIKKFIRTMMLNIQSSGQLRFLGLLQGWLFAFTKH